jgi:hypothetical protein
LRLVDFESACWKLGAFIDAALESFRLLHRGGEARACSGLGEGQPPSSRGYGPEPGDSSVFEMAAAIRLVLGGMAKDLAFAADSGLPGRVRVSRLFRLLPFLDWRGLRSRLGALESELLRMPENDPAFGSCAARALAIRRLVEFGPGRLGDRLGAAAKSIIGVWRLLEPFHHQPGGLSGPAAN